MEYNISIDAIRWKISKSTNVFFKIVLYYALRQDTTLASDSYTNPQQLTKPWLSAKSQICLKTRLFTRAYKALICYNYDAILHAYKCNPNYATFDFIYYDAISNIKTSYYRRYCNENYVT